MTDAGNYLAITWQMTTEQVDQVVAEAWSAGVLGCQTLDDEGGSRRLIGYFADRNADFADGMSLPEGVREIDRGHLSDQDWLRAYRASVEPIEVGRLWLLDPREPGVASLGDDLNDDRILLRLPARRAFGTGGHESTRLALCLLETTPLAGRTVFDLGYGSGVLSFAVAALGGCCLAVERDLTAALVGGLNRRLNPRVPAAMIAGEVEATSEDLRLDVLLVNARPANWLPAGAALADRLRPDSAVICSGMLTEELDEVTERVAFWGWRPEALLTENDWSALSLRVA